MCPAPLKLVIHPRGGMAGDMFAAALISAGADFKVLHQAMISAASKLGTAAISINRTADGSSQLGIDLSPHHRHLGGAEAQTILRKLFAELNSETEYRELGFRILDILLKAEGIAHRDGKFAHLHHHHKDGETTFLHEAQDIVIDIIGAVTGLQNLNIEPSARLLAPVSVGGGTVKFSHGVLPVPAPAAEIILRTYRIPWSLGPIAEELCTPTGAAILAALNADTIQKSETDFNIQKRGQSRGSKILDIPPLKILLTKN
jgi:uncharacterized protein (DUF111 family)